jgi:hypothetical protein
MPGASGPLSAVRLAVVFVAFACCAVGAAPAAATRSHRSARVAPASNVVLGGSFHRIGVSPAGGLLASGDYVLFNTALTYPPNLAWIVINDRLGTTTALDPRCQVAGLGPPWLLMSCPQTSDPNGPYDLELYSLADGTRQTVTPSPRLPPPCGSTSDVETECAWPAAVGANWIRWDASCYHCGTTFYFQNIQTGEVRGDPTDATTYADLNSPTLAEKTCPGVKVLRESVGYSTGWGSLNSYGQFALATGTDGQGNPAAFLEQCGTGMRRLLASWPLGTSIPLLTSNAGAIVWQPAPNRLNEPYNRLDGLFLPSLQTFTIPLPSAIVTGTGLEPIALTSEELYLRVWETGTVWRTASPTVLPLNTSRPSLTRSATALRCSRGSWRNATHFSYAWRINGTEKKAVGPTLAVGKARVRGTVNCSVIASNRAGTTAASSAPLHVR